LNLKLELVLYQQKKN